LPWWWQLMLSFITFYFTFGCKRQHNNVLWFTPLYVVRRQLGCTLFKGAHCTPVFPSQLQADSNHESRGYLRCFSVVGVKAFHGSYELACKREVRCLDAVGIPSFYFFGDEVGGHYRATGSTGGGLHSLVQVAGLSAHRLRAASWYLIFFFGIE